MQIINGGLFEGGITLTLPPPPLPPTANNGWFGGGSPTTARVDRIDFANDTATASIKGSLSLARFQIAATGNDNYGWFAGGLVPGVRSTIDRITFATDTNTASIRGSLSLARGTADGAGNTDNGWFSGGRNPSNNPAEYSRVDRIIFATDTSTASTRGPLSLARSGLASADNDNYGWFAGGFNPASPNYMSLIDRIDFADDTGAASVRGSLSVGRDFLGSADNNSYGWFAGGASFQSFSRIDRVDFASDTNTASVRGSLFLDNFTLAGTSSDEYGWFGGGFDSSDSSLVQRITFATDTSTASIRGSLSLARGGLNATAGII